MLAYEINTCDSHVSQVTYHVFVKSTGENVRIHAI